MNELRWEKKRKPRRRESFRVYGWNGFIGDSKIRALHINEKRPNEFFIHGLLPELSRSYPPVDNLVMAQWMAESIFEGWLDSAGLKFKDTIS